VLPGNCVAVVDVEGRCNMTPGTDAQEAAAATTCELTDEVCTSSQGDGVCEYVPPMTDAEKATFNGDFPDGKIKKRTDQAGCNKEALMSIAAFGDRLESAEWAAAPGVWDDPTAINICKPYASSPPSPECKFMPSEDYIGDGLGHCDQPLIAEGTFSGPRCGAAKNTADGTCLYIPKGMRRCTGTAESGCDTSVIFKPEDFEACDSITVKDDCDREAVDLPVREGAGAPVPVLACTWTSEGDGAGRCTAKVNEEGCYEEDNDGSGQIGGLIAGCIIKSSETAGCNGEVSEDNCKTKGDDCYWEGGRCDGDSGPTCLYDGLKDACAKSGERVESCVATDPDDPATDCSGFTPGDATSCRTADGCTYQARVEGTCAEPKKCKLDGDTCTGVVAADDALCTYQPAKCCNLGGKRQTGELGPGTWGSTMWCDGKKSDFTTMGDGCVDPGTTCGATRTTEAGGGKVDTLVRHYMPPPREGNDDFGAICAAEAFDAWGGSGISELSDSNKSKILENPFCRHLITKKCDPDKPEPNVPVGEIGFVDALVAMWNSIFGDEEVETPPDADGGYEVTLFGECGPVGPTGNTNTGNTNTGNTNTGNTG
jgi:hypothetical protein